MLGNKGISVSKTYIFQCRFNRYRAFIKGLSAECQILGIPFRCVCRKAEMHENRRFFSTGVEFAKNPNAYAYVLKATSRS